MTVDYDPAEVARLEAEARRDHERMTPGPWVAEGDELYSDTRQGGTIQLAGFTQDADEGCQLAIARTRNNLQSIADQLGAGRREVERVTKRWRDEEQAINRKDIQLDEARADRDRLRCQLETAQQEARRCIFDGHEGRIAELVQRRDARESDLSGAQHRIAELERENDMLASTANTFAEMDAALRAIWQVYRAAEACELSDQENERGEYVSHETAELNLSRAVDAARAALTPKILAALKAA
jgi:chromosome segregation ATPase